MAQSARKNVTPLSGVTRKNLPPGHSCAGRNPGQREMALPLFGLAREWRVSSTPCHLSGAALCRLGIAQHQIDVPGYGLASFLMGNAHPTSFPRYTAPRCNVFPGAPRHIRHGRTISRVAPSYFLKIGGNHIFISCTCYLHNFHPDSSISTTKCKA
jgi:hypothetical protein